MNGEQCVVKSEQSTVNSEWLAVSTLVTTLYQRGLMMNGSCRRIIVNMCSACVCYAD